MVRELSNRELAARRLARDHQRAVGALAALTARSLERGHRHNADAGAPRAGPGDLATPAVIDAFASALGELAVLAENDRRWYAAARTRQLLNHIERYLALLDREEALTRQILGSGAPPPRAARPPAETSLPRRSRPRGSRQRS
jgi:hypothetical protein